MDKGKFSLMLASAFYEVKAYSPYLASLLNSIQVLQQAKIPYCFINISGDGYVDRAKNGLADTFLKSEYTHLMIIDSDLEWEVEGFGKLLKAAMSGAELVGGAYRVKGDYSEYAVSPVVKDGQYVGNEECGFPVLQVWSLPGGFAIYSRKAIERTRPELNTYDMDGPVLELFRCEIAENGARLGEDMYFQRKFMAQGGKIYLVPDMNVTHWGVKGFEGNFDREIQRRPGSRSYEHMIERLRSKHMKETAWIIGKGPSLQYLKKDNIGPGPVIAISEAIIPIEKLGLDNPIYSLQKDVDPPEKEPISPPISATLLVQEREVPGRHKNYKPRYIFDNPLDFDANWNTCSSVTATHIAMLLGCRNIVYVSFDAAVNGNTDSCHYNSDGTHTIDSEHAWAKDDSREYIKMGLGLKRFITKKYLAAQWLIPEPQGVENGTKKQADTY